MADDPPVSEPAGRVRHRPDPLLLVCLALLFGFPVAAWLAADAQPIAPSQSQRVSVPQGPGADVKLRDLPAFDTEPDLAAAFASRSGMRRAVSKALNDAFDPFTAEELLRIARTTDFEFFAGEPINADEITYPFRYSRIDPLLEGLDLDPVKAGDAAALLIIAAAQGGGEDVFEGDFPQAPQVAFAILDRARAGGDCLPQLNLALLLSTDTNPRDDDVALEYGKAAKSCPGDPTPLWLLGQFQSQRALLLNDDDRPGQSVKETDRMRRPFATFQRMQGAWPRSSLGWAGEADAELRLAYQMRGERPFGSRQHFRRALELYRAAQRIDRDPVLAAGTARALAGLERHGPAADAMAAAIEGREFTGPLRARQVEYLESAGRFAQAAEAAATLEAEPEFAPFRVVFPEVIDSSGVFFTVDANGPLSTGSDRMQAIRLNVGPPPGGAGSGGSDLSFIPLYRDWAGVTGHERWCPGWSRRRDLVLAGRAGEALDGMPSKFRDVRPWKDGECGFGSPLLRGLAELELGRRADALASAKAAKNFGNQAPEVVLADSRQDLWRFAGDYKRAARAAAAWARERPADPLAHDRAGEIAFLDGRYQDAVREFGRAVLEARAAYGGWTVDESSSLLKRGVALGRLEQFPAALDSLEEADEVATRMEAFGRDDPKLSEQGIRIKAVWFSYHARAQAGDVALRAQRYELAAEHYQTGEERLPDLSFDLPSRVAEPLLRPEVLHNNRSLAETKVGRPDVALTEARRAVSADPENPLFRETEGFALQRLGRDDQAVRAYRFGLESDPTMYPAWNDLGVLLLEDDRPEPAADALRRAVGAREDYALGWFNLGVAQEKRGPLHIFAAQGALARAVSLDSRLRERPREPIADDAVYVTQLDLSKPLPAAWSFSRTQERAPVVAASFAVLLLLGLRLTRGLAGQSGASGPAKQFYDVSQGLIARVPNVLRFTPAVVAVLVTFAVFVWPLLRTGGASTASVLVLLAGLVLLVTIVLRARVLVARRAEVSLEQRGWSPAIVFGIGAGVFGAPWAPLPVASTSKPLPSLHWVGPALAGGVALVLLLLAAGLQIPVARSLGEASLVMAASMLTPIPPLDGAAVARGTAGLAASTALLGVGVLSLVGLG